MVNFNGKYKWVKNEDYDDFVEKMGKNLKKLCTVTDLEGEDGHKPSYLG